MRYSIMGFNQEKLLQYEIDMTDVLLLDYIQKALSQPSMTKTFKDNQPYVWLQHPKILEDLPILNIQEGMLKKRISKLVEIGLIESISIANLQGRGSRAYYTITEKFEDLQTTKDNFLYSVERPGIKNYPSNNKLNNNSNIISKDIILHEPEVNHSQSNLLNNCNIPIKKTKESLWDKCIRMINDFTDDEVLRDMLVNSFKLFLDNSKEGNVPFYSNTFKGKLNNLKKLSDDIDVQKDIILQTLDNGWNNFYTLKNNVKQKNVAKDIEHLYCGMNERAEKGGNIVEKF